MELGTIRKLFRYMSHVRRELIFAFIAGIIGNIMSLSYPVFIGKAVDAAIGYGNVNFKNVYTNIFYLIILSAFGGVFYWITGYYSASAAFKTSNKLRIHLFKRLNSVHIGYIDSTSHGDIISRVINDLEAVSEGILQCCGQAFLGVVTIVGTIFFMLGIDLWLSLIVMILTPISAVVTWFIAKVSYRTFREQANIQGEITGYAEEMISGQKVVTAFKYGDKSVEEFEKINKRLYKSGVESQFYSSVANPAARFLTGIIYASVGIAGAVMIVSGGSLTIGGLSSILIYASQYARPFNEITGVVTQIQTALAAIQRVFKILEEPIEHPDNSNSRKIQNCKGRVDIDNVSFSYDKKRPIIRNFSLSVEPGQRVAIVGPTGCGKTTIINLLMRFYEPDSGTIKIDGVPINEMKRKDLRDLYGMVLQDTWLHSGSVKDNISYGLSSVTDEKIIESAKLSRAHEFIIKMENGYDSLISEDGNNISQGQKQLMCIARVMISNPDILILDEATSSIDTRTEAMVQEAFLNLMNGRTSFIIAHRLSTIKNADIILVMNNGNIIEKGTHKQLLDMGGFYANLHYSQFSNI